MKTIKSEKVILSIRVYPQVKESIKEYAHDLNLEHEYQERQKQKEKRKNAK